MRNEIQRAKEIMQKAANNAKLYHENIARVRRTCKPEHILNEVMTYADPLRQSMTQAVQEIEEALSGLEAKLKAGIIIRGEDYDSATMAAISALEPGAAELTEIAKRYEGNETMLRALDQYNIKHKVGAEIPVSGQSKVDALDMIRADINYVLQQAGSLDSKYGSDQLQHFAENFDAVFCDRISIIGE